MKIIIPALIAATFATAPLIAGTSDVPSNTAYARTAALLDSGAEVRVNQVNVEVRTANPNYQPYYHHHHRRYRTVKIVRYRDGVRYVTYRRVYYRNNG